MAIEPKEWAEGDLYPAARMTELETEVVTAKSAASRALTPDSTLDMTKIGETTGYSRDLMRVESAAAARTHLGAGTSSLTIGTTGNTAAAGNHTHGDLVSKSAFDELAARVAALESTDEPAE